MPRLECFLNPGENQPDEMSRSRPFEQHRDLIVVAAEVGGCRPGWHGRRVQSRISHAVFAAFQLTRAQRLQIRTEARPQQARILNLGPRQCHNPLGVEPAVQEQGCPIAITS